MFVIQNDKPKTLPAGAYQAKFVAYTEATTKNGPALRWSWEVTQGEHKGETAVCHTDPASVTPPTAANALGRLLAGLAGRPLGGGDAYDPKEAIGKLYTVVVSPGPKGGGLCVRTVAPAL